MKNQLTLVTTLFDIGRDKLPEGFARKFDHYLNCFAKLLEVDYPMIIFAPDDLREFINQHRKGKKTHIVKKEISDLKNFTFIDQVTKIRTQSEWINRAGWIPDSPQAKLELYNPLVMSKQFFMNDASIFNVFNTKYFLWLDAGISNTIGDPKGYLDEHFVEKISTMFNDNKMHYVCFPYVANTEVHGFEKMGMDRYAGEETKYVARGGIFGGTRDAIAAINEVYYNMLSSTLGAGYMGTEESVYTILTYQYPHLCTKHMIESNGLVYKFLEKVKNTPLPKHNELLSIYSLTFNKPEQFKLWVESFEANMEASLKYDAKRYVINNSTDKSVDKQYQELFKKYNFTEIKFNNIGICGGRQFAAEHFSESNSKYMLFFEDDMLLYGPEDKGHCKNGYRRYFPNLITNSMSIMEMERLDYLKLCFSELYGDNNDNWAWYNAPNEKTKKEWFPVESTIVDAKKTKVFYLNSFKAIPYAVGEYHYCNWPILFNQEGNRKVFLETKFEHKFEQTWMSFVMGLMRKGEIKAGCILGSAINHRRQYHYDKNIRRENEHFTN